MFSLQDKQAVITGAGSGIGRAVAILLARQGAAVYVTDINEEQAKEVVAEIVSQGGEATAVKADVANQLRGGFE